VASVEHIAVLGSHPISSGLHPRTVWDGGLDREGTDQWFDAIDLLLKTSDSRVVAFGIRTKDYILSTRGTTEQSWGDYVPIPTTLEMADVRFWDFSEVLWVGPANWPCLVWSNADVSIKAFQNNSLFDPVKPSKLLDGLDGRGLPTPADIGLTVPSLLHWYQLKRTPPT